MGCSSSSAPAPPPDWFAQRSRLPLYEATSYRLSWIDTAGQKVLLRAARLQLHKQGDSTCWRLAGNVELVHYAPNGDTLQVLRSRRGELWPQQGYFVAQDSVTVRTQDGLFLETDYLIWRQAQHRLEAPGWVRLQTPEETLTGQGLEYHTEKRTYRLRRTRGLVQAPPL